MTRDVCAVVGGQFGSEGKGAVVAAIAGEYAHHVRVGGANAGHTFYVDGGKVVTQQLPVGAWANPDARCYIGPGAMINQDILISEFERNAEWRRSKGIEPLQLFIDWRAHVITAEQCERERLTDLAVRIGSTSATAAEGIGVATADRVMRRVNCQMVGLASMNGRRAQVDVPEALHRARGGILLEGTQGAGLSLTTGYFPYVTSRNTTSAGLCADAGVAPTRVGRVVLVVRTFPIRVAGQSGPFALDSLEIGWLELGVDPESERTTVTKKVRRVATFSSAQLVESVRLNGATEVALMFADYYDRAVAGRTDPEVLSEALELPQFVRAVERVAGVPVTVLGTGPETMIRLPGGIGESQ